MNTSTTQGEQSIATNVTALLHDLRSPLHAVIGQLDLATDNKDVAIVERHLAAARMAADHLRRVIDHLTDTEPAPLDSVLTDATAMCRALYPHMEINLPSPIPVAYFLERVGAVRLILNLLTNCARHGTGPIDISVVGDDAMFIDIDDAGDGVHPSQSSIGLASAAALTQSLGLTLTPSPRGGWRLGHISPSRTSSP